MTILEIILGIFLIFSSAIAVIEFILLRKIDEINQRLQRQFIELSIVFGDYKDKIDALFEMNIHYYDEVIYEFVEETKKVKFELDNALRNTELEDNIYPERPPAQQPTEVLGVIKRPIR